MDEIREFFKRDRFAAYNGIKLLEISKGSATAQMMVTDRHLNGISTVHGGALFTLADFTFAVAANSWGRVTVATNANISYLKAVTSGVLTATAREVSKGFRIANYTVEITDEDCDLVALFHGTAYRKKEKLEEITK
ncbi:MAG TPA: PaaI family thioesterase [Methanobacteriaceae archaeon]|nr:PaaI family thioesterase [Methanobacteriaceae archaeon]